jgi:protein phosphatase
VASATAVRAFEDGLPGGSPGPALVGLIERANREIHDRSRSDAHMAGMGTTITAAYLAEDDAVVVAHVGDSRCYLLRGGNLQQLTRDHSLVDELLRQGKLTPEQAETHPQRSVITRALGPEPDVTVDVEPYPARAGDVFLLCSDGLTTMVPETRLKPIIEEAPSLEAAGRSLIQAANAAGGRDNITVILFRIEEVPGSGGPSGGVDREAETGEHRAARTAAATTVQPTRVQGDAVRSQDVAAAVADADAAEHEYRRSGTVAMRAIPREHPASEGRTLDEPAPARPVNGSPGREPAAGTAHGARAAGGPRRRARAILKPLLVVAVLLGFVLAAGWQASRAVFFLGTDPRDDRTVTIFKGLPYELPFGIELYQRYRTSGVTIDQVPPARRETFTDHKLRSRDDVEDLVIALERGRLNQ